MVKTKLQKKRVWHNCRTVRCGHVSEIAKEYKRECFVMEKPSFFKNLKPSDRYMVGNLFFLYLIQGIYVIMIGSILPMMKEEYGLSYQVGGFLISAHSIGNMATGLIAGVLPLAFGLRRSLLVQNVLPFAGFAITLVTGNPWILIFALLLTGLGRGAVSNYNNQIISTLSGGSAAPLNMLHGFFAIGAVLAPFLVLIFTRENAGGWRWVVCVVIALGLISMVSSLFMNMDSVSYSKPESGGSAFGFLRNRLFLRSMAIMFFYLCVEASVMGWMVTYYTDSGAAGAESAQLLTSLLWITILAGRFGCSAVSGRVAPPRMILALCTGIMVFLGILLMSTSLPLMLVGTVGLGLSLSGMYGTTVANAGGIFGAYPLAMGIFVMVSTMGSVITPSIIGGVAAYTGIRAGMAVLLVPAAIALALAGWNWVCAKSRGEQMEENMVR